MRGVGCVIHRTSPPGHCHARTVRILFCSTAATGHFNPLIPVARACAGAGHQVRVAAPASFENHVRRAGLDHAPFDDVPPQIAGPIYASLPTLSMEEANRRVVREIFAGHAARHAIPGVLATIDDWGPDLVVREPAEFGSLVAAQAARVPHVEVLAGLAEVTALLLAELDEPLAALESDAGLAQGTLLRSITSSPCCTSVPASLDGGPGHGDRPVWRYRADSGPRPTGSLPEAWGDPDLPLVYATFGTVAGAFDTFTQVYARTLEALAGQPVRVLLTTGHSLDPESLRPWPANAHVRQWWPQDQVMPLASAMVGHGGFGTTMAALEAGVPQVVLPLFAFDQWVNAGRVQAVGAGRMLDGGAAATTELAAAVAEVTHDPAYRQRAETLAADFTALPDVATLVPLLTDHVRTAT